MLCTQCETEVQTHPIFLDRPDVLSRYTTTITADEKKFLCCVNTLVAQ